MLTGVYTENFRNLKTDTIELHSGVNLFIGRNGAGKTNFLESIHLAACGKSWKNAGNLDFIRFGADYARVAAETSGGSGRKIEVRLRGSGGSGLPKEIFVGGAQIRRLGELYGALRLVSFSPEDVWVVKLGPAERRRLLDMELCQTSSVYYYNLKQYYHTLKQRNACLRGLFGRPLRDFAELEVWDEALAGFGAEIISARRAFCRELADCAAEIHAELSGGAEDFKALYRPNAEEAALLPKLRRTAERDVNLGATSAGPHKDDLTLLLNGREAKLYASQGQQRSVCLSLKLAVLRRAAENSAEPPVLLLDDVFSELDGKRRRYLMDCAGRSQTLITSAEASDIAGDRVFLVENGEISKIR
ncbi:MAG: DNA replication/repair protein RecF [Clostridiales bacterium]|jgi:DNA replication and repair protein RecF|nr:DNA replication/repair protein RecF [Clostridiales bacterium]